MTLLEGRLQASSRRELIGPAHNSVLMVLTRDPQKEVGGRIDGRVRTLRSIIAAAEACGPVRFAHLPSLVEQKAYATLGMRFFFRMPSGFVRRNWPLQCILFDHPGPIEALISAIEETGPAVVYFDSVRCYSAIRRTRARFPHLRLVCDFDDLMSRRLELLRGLKRGMALGYLRRFLPSWLRNAIENSSGVSNAVLRYEAANMVRAEDEIMRLVDGVTLVSWAEAAILEQRQNTRRRAAITVAPPPFTARRAIEEPEPPYRFVFIGSDRVLQNRLTIDWLLTVWSTHRPPYPLRIFGAQTRSYLPVEGVIWEGFAEDLSDVYAPGSVLLAPAFLPGGVKTKICEAASHGVIPLGNRISFEGIALHGNALAMSNEELIDTVMRLPKCVSTLTAQARRLQQYLAAAHAVESYQETWNRVLFRL